MFDTLSKADLQKAQHDMSNHVDPLVVAHAGAALLRALLAEEIAKRPDDPKPAEETPAENPVEASDDETPSRRRARERA